MSYCSQINGHYLNSLLTPKKHYGLITSPPSYDWRHDSFNRAWQKCLTSKNKVATGAAVEGRDGSWWRRWGTLTMVSRAGRAFPTVHTDLLLASLMPDNITTSGTRMLDITIKRGRCLTLSQKQELPSSWKNFTNQPLNSLPTENMNLTW